MTPIKLDAFLKETRVTSPSETIVNLIDFGLFHAAPRENGYPLLAMRFDPTTGTLKPAA